MTEIWSVTRYSFVVVIIMRTRDTSVETALQWYILRENYIIAALYQWPLLDYTNLSGLLFYVFIFCVSLFQN